MSKKEIKTETVSIRLTSAQVEGLNQRQVKLAPLVQDLVARLLEPNKCPTCGQKLIKRN